LKPAQKDAGKDVTTQSPSSPVTKSATKKKILVQRSMHEFTPTGRNREWTPEELEEARKATQPGHSIKHGEMSSTALPVGTIDFFESLPLPNIDVSDTAAPPQAGQYITNHVSK
jgi:hypothetical protein